MMGAISSKEHLMKKAIETQDVNAMLVVMKDLTPKQRRTMCKTLVPGNENQCTILHYAVWQDNLKLLKLLLKYTVDLEIRDGLDWTPLMTAVNRDSKENVKILLKHGAKIDCDSLQGMNLIATAMSFNDVELIEILMDHGAQSTISSDKNADEENPTGCYLLHFAVDDGLLDVTNLLIRKGQIPINTLDQRGWSPLHLAAEHNYLDIVKLLVENGADVNIKDHHGNTPLAWARETNAKEVFDELEKLGGIADKEWYGEKLRSNSYKEKHGIENSQFEIEESIEDNTLNNTKPNILDALQRQG